jgi:acylphosphatase
MAIAKLVVFSGYVQGVGFRFTAKQVAQRYELTGYVRNRDDGKVEMRMQGEPQDIDDCIADLKEAFAIRDVKTEEADFNSSFKDFGIAL